MDLKPGDIILVKGTGIISELIEDVSKGQYSHTAIYINKNIIVEAEGFEKTGYVNIDKYKGHADVYRFDKLTDKEQLRIVMYLRKQLGTHYDYLLLFWEFLRYRLHILLPYKEFHNHICSTLARDAYKSIRLELCPGIKYPSPSEIGKSKLLIKVGSI